MNLEEYVSIDVTNGILEKKVRQKIIGPYYLNEFHSESFLGKEFRKFILTKQVV